MVYSVKREPGNIKVISPEFLTKSFSVLFYLQNTVCVKKI